MNAILRHRLESDDLAGHLLLAGRELVDAVRYMFLTGGDDLVDAARYLLHLVRNRLRSRSPRRQPAMTCLAAPL